MNEKEKQGKQKGYRDESSEEVAHQRFRAIHDHAAIGIERVGMNGRLLDVNQKLADMLGYTREELVGRPVTELVHPDDWDREQALLDQLMAGEIPSYTIEKRYQRKDGRVIWGSFTTWLVQDARPPHRVAVMEDITERMQARQRIDQLHAAVEQNRAQLEAVISSISDGLSIHDTQGRLVMASRAGLAMLGIYNMEEAPKDLADYPDIFELRDLSGRVLPMSEWPILRSLRGETFSNVEIEVRRKDTGLVRIGSFSGGPVRDAKGEIIWGVITAQDITERKKAEQALQESETRLREVLDNAQDIIYRVDLTTNRVDYISAVSERITGYMRERLLGMTRQDIISLLHPDDQAVYLDRTRALLQSSEERPKDRADYRWKVGEGVYHWFDLGRTLIRDSEGRPRALVISARDITEQKEAEQALRDGERKLRNLIDYSTDGISLLDESGAIVEWNPALEKITGIPKERALGQGMWDVLAELQPERLQGEPGVRDRLYKQITTFLQTGQGDWLSHINEGQIKRADGTSRNVQVIMFPIETEHGWMVGGISRDVTEQKKAEEALRASEARLREVLENSRDAIYRYDVQAERYEYFSPAIQDISGFAPEELMQMNNKELLEHIHPEDRSAYVDHNQALTHSDQERPADRVEYRWRGKDGNYRWMSVHRVLVRDGSGQPMAHVGAIRDITEQKKAEQALAESEARLREVIMNSQDAIYRYNFRTQSFDFFSPSAETITGFSASEMGAMGLDGVLARVHPDDWAATVRRLQEETEHPGESRRPLEYRWQTKSGEWRWFSDSRSVIADERGQPLALVAVSRDITEQRQAEEVIRQSEARLKELADTLEQRVAERTIQLRALASELSRAEERERRRLARVLHDHLQQLLVAARLNVNTLQRKLGQESLQQATKQLDQVLGEAIDTSRTLTAELSPPVLYDAGLAPGLHWLSRWMQEKHGLQVEVDAEDLGNVTPESIRSMMFQAARELLFNVVKHAGVNRAVVRLRRVTGDELELTVSDQGVGFDPSKVGRAEEGGFGLFSIQERLEMVGGRMEVQSAPGKGTRVTLRVPMYPMATEAATIAAEEAAGRLARVSTAEERAAEREAAAVGERPIRVLLADDHVIVRQGLARLLQDDPGIELVGEADDGREALALVRMVHPDVVLMDVSMPVMDGVEATRRILAEQPDMKVIGLSMYEGDEMAERMYRAGAVDYVFKGSDPSEMIRAVRRWAEKVTA